MMISLWQIAVSVALCLVVLLSQTSALYSEEEPQFGMTSQFSDTDADTDEFLRQARGVGMRPQVFPCNGHDHLARCQHGGRGPKKTWTKAGRYCVCLCANKWRGPECGYTAESLKKRYPAFGKAKRDNEYPLAQLMSE